MVTVRPHPPGRIDFPGRNAGENLQFYYRHHWIRLAGTFFGTLVLTITAAVIGFFVLPADSADRDATWHLVLVALLLSFFAVQTQFLIRFYSHFLRLVIVTDQSIHRVRKTLLAFDDHEVIDLASLQDAHKSQRGVVQNLLGYGTLILEAQHTVLRIHFTPHIARTHQWMMELRDQARRQSMTPSLRDRSPYQHADSSR